MAINQAGSPDGSTEQGHPVVNPQDARQGQKTGYMRYVLGISLTLAVLALGGTWLAFERPPNTPAASSSVSQKTEAPILRQDSAPKQVQ